MILAQDQSGGGLGGLAVLVPLAAVFYFVAIRPNRRRMREMQAVQSSLEPGRQVITTAGLHATVAALDEEDGTVTLEIAPGVQAKFARGAVLKVVELPAEVAAAGSDE